MVLSQEDIISYRNLLFLWCFPKKISSHTEIYCFYGIVQRRYYFLQKSINTNSCHGYVQGACARKRRYYLIQKIINNNSFYGLAQRRNYLIQKSINNNSFYGLVPRRYYFIQKIINTNSFHGYVQGACARKRRYCLIQKI